MIARQMQRPLFRLCLAWLWHFVDIRASSGDSDGHHTLLPLPHGSVAVVAGRLIPAEPSYSSCLLEVSSFSVHFESVLQYSPL